MAATLAALLLLALPSPSTPQALAGGPTEQLRAGVDRVIAALGDPAFAGEARAAERRRAVRSGAENLFDLDEAARRSLGRHWRDRTTAEQREFVTLFGDVLERAYLSRLELYGGERIVYVSEAVDGDFAVVRTRIVLPQRGAEAPVEYRMLRRGEAWLVYDVTIEGVSLASASRRFTLGSRIVLNGIIALPPWRSGQRGPKTAAATVAIPAASTAMTVLESSSAPGPSQYVAGADSRDVEGERQMLQCRDIVDLVDDYLDGTLDRLHAAALAAHLADCQDCTAFFNTYRGTLRASRHLREDQLPPELRERLVSFLRHSSSSTGRTAPLARARWWTRLWRVLHREERAT